jgi:hypothetical protein
MHLVSGVWPVTARETRWETACGDPAGRETLAEPDGELRCVRCLRRVLVAGQVVG